MPEKKTKTKTSKNKVEVNESNKNKKKEAAKKELALRPRVYAPEQIMPNVQSLMTLGDALSKSGMFPNAKTAAGAVAIIEAGRELGIKPVMALNTMYVVSGKLGIQSVALAALSKESGISIEIIQKDKKGCRLKFSRPGQPAYEESFNVEDAERAELLGKDNYKKYPEEMFYCRCLAKGIRVYDPALTLGMYTVEELKDVDDKDFMKPGVVIDVKPEKEDEKKPESYKVDSPKPIEKGKSPGEMDKPPDDVETAGTEDPAKEKEDIIEFIKNDLKTRGIKASEFKEFLQLYQTSEEHKKTRVFVALNNFKKWSFHEGDLEDLRLYKGHINVVMKAYAKYQEEQEAQKKKEEDKNPF